MLTTANKIKTAAAAKPKPNDHQLYGNAETFWVAWKPKRLPYNFPELARPAQKEPATAAPVAAFSVHFQCQKNRSLRLQALFQIAQRISVARRGGVLRNSQRSGDLAKGKVIPDFQDQHLPLITRQRIHSRGEC